MGSQAPLRLKRKPLRVPQKRGIEEEVKALRTEHHLEKENVLVQYRALLQEVIGDRGAQLTVSHLV